MRSLAFILASGVFLAAAALADWPNFRGPRHDGISAEKGLKSTWPEPPKMLWEAKVGDSFSGMSIVGDRLYTCGTADKKQQVLCLDANTGKPIWNFPLENGYFEPQGGNGARATPTIADGKLYLLGALGRLVCLDAKDGKVVWEKKFEGKPQWGFSASVLIEGDLAITSGGGKQGALIAYDKKDGKEIWKYGTDKAGYSTPYPFTMGDKRYLVGFTGTKVSIVHAESGAVAWDTAWKTDWDVNAASPIFDAGKLFISSGYDTGSAVFSLEADGDKLSGKNLWGEVKKVLLSKFQSAVLHEGNLYCSDQRKLACVDFLTGEEKWKEPRMENATLVLVENDLFIQCEDGKFVIAPATPSGFKPSATFKTLEGKCWTVPTLDNGRLYTRSLDTIRCFEMR